jgi:uncharacterized glyoxalase superfamily protein PhnB
MNRIFPFILVEDAKEAIEFYRKALNATLLGEITYYKEWDIKAQYPDKIVHAALRIEDSQMFIADAINELEDQQERFTVNIELPSKEAVLHAFEVLKEEAVKIYYPPQDVGWSDLGFSLKDKFKVIFLIYYRA